MPTMAESPLSNISGIITLQVGHYSNFIGTHWWNIQQSARRAQECSNSNTDIRHGLFLREDAKFGTGRTIYTPRLLCIDLKGCLSSLKVDGSFQTSFGEERRRDVQQTIVENETATEKIAPNELSVHQTEPMERYELVDNFDASAEKKFEVTEDDSSHKSHSSEPTFLSLDESRVEVWSDFLGDEYNRHSVLLLDDYWHSPDSCSFSSFGQGLAATANHQFWDSWEDGMRFFAEECDQLQGFQILTDLEDGFGGLAVTVLENLKDCYGPKASAVYGCWPGIPNQYINENIEILNSALAVSSITQNNQLFTPLSLQETFYGKEKTHRNFMNLSYKPQSHYHTSAIIASYLDTMSLQYRLGTSSLSDFCNGITATGHSVASANMSILPNITSLSLENILKSSTVEERLMTPLTPSVNDILQTLFTHHMVLRGIPSESENFGVGRMGLQKRVSNKDMFEKYVFDTYKSYRTGTTFCEQPLQTLQTCQRFPASKFGGIRFLPTLGENNGSLNKTAILSSLSTSTGVFDFVHEVVKSARRVKDSVCTSTEYYGMEKDEINESIEHLVSLAHSYDEKRATGFL